MQSTRFQQHLDRYLGIPLCLVLGLFPKPSPEQRTPKKILFIQLSALGDTILAVPTLRAVRYAFPDAELTLLASQTNLRYVAACPYLDRRIPFHGPGYRLISQLRRERFDCVIDLEHWPRLSALLAYATRAPIRLGFSTKGQYRHLLFSETVPHIQGQHEVRNFMSLARLLGCESSNLQLEVWSREADRRWVADVLKEAGVAPEKPIVVLHPEAGRRGEPRRRWPEGRYVALANMLVEKSDAAIVLTGAPDEAPLSEAIAAQMRHRPVVLAGRTDVNQLAALFAVARVVVSGNCGPMHLAAAAGAPVIGIHGPTSRAQWGPWSAEASSIRSRLPCSPCLNLGFEYGCQALPDGTSPCMHTIAVMEVFRACEVVLSTGKK